MNGFLNRSRFLWLLSSWLILAALVFGYLARRESRRAEVVVEWTTASELSTAGFNLYRSGSADGSFSQINNELIPASTDPLTGGSYEYIDSHVEPGITYYYELEDVEFDGNSSRYGPIEVQASRGGSLELWFSLFLIGAGIVGLLLQNRKRAEKHERHQPR